MSIAAELVLGGILLIPKLRMAAHFSPSVGYVRSKSAFEVRWELGRRKIEEEMIVLR